MNIDQSIKKQRTKRKKEKSRNSTNIYRSTMISLTSKTHTRKAVFLQTTKSFSRDVTWGWITRRGFARMTHVSFLRVTPESRNIKYKIVRETPIWTHSYRTGRDRFPGSSCTNHACREPPDCRPSRSLD